VGEPWIYVEGADPKTRAFWSLEEFRDEPLRTGTRVNSFEEAFAAVVAGLAITCQGESAIRTVGAAFPQLRPVPLEGVEPARVAVAWRSREETELTRMFVATALAVATHNRTR
jgi:DNA-binding transcriptional LysR family regulator